MAISLREFLGNLVQSGLMTGDEVSTFRDALPPNRQAADAQTLARELILAGKLTKYQAQCVYQGKTKGLVFGEYVILDKIGQGGMGQVLKARHRTMERIVALKILPPKSVDSPEAVKRFRREARAAARLSHPNIVMAFDAGEHHGIHFLAMEYVEGKDLSSVVKELGRLEVRQALDCVLQAAKGLAYAHRQGVIHRDIKPGNLLLDKEGTVKILDMGLARIDPGGAAQGRGTERLTQSGAAMGTCDYMAPEQAFDTHRADGRSDVYSLGCTLYRLLTGDPPYSRDTLVQILIAHREARIPSLRDARPDVPEEVDAVFQKMVAKEPEDRQQSMAEVISDLEGCLAMMARPPEADSGSELLLARPGSVSLLQNLSFLQEAVPPPLPTQSRGAVAADVALRSGARKPLVFIGVAAGSAALVILTGLLFSLLGSRETVPPLHPGGGRNQGRPKIGSRATEPREPFAEIAQQLPDTSQTNAAGAAPGLPSSAGAKGALPNAEGTAPPGAGPPETVPLDVWIPLSGREAESRGQQTGEGKIVFGDKRIEFRLPSPLDFTKPQPIIWTAPVRASDAVIRGRVKMLPSGATPDVGSASLILRCTETREGLRFYLAPFSKDQNMTIAYLHGPGWNEFTRVAAPAHAEFVDMEFAAVGDTLTLTVNGKVLAEVKDQQIGRGDRIGVMVDRTNAIFEDLQYKVLRR